MSDSTRAEQEGADEPHSGRHRDGERRHPGKEHPVRDPDHLGLVALLPADAVIDGRRHQQDRRRERGEQADVEDELEPVADLAEPRRERHRQQEREEELRAGKRHAQLVEELEELPVGPLLGRLASPHLRRAVMAQRRAGDDRTAGGMRTSTIRTAPWMRSPTPGLLDVQTASSGSLRAEPAHRIDQPGGPYRARASAGAEHSNRERP